MPRRPLWDRPPRDGERIQAHYTQEPVQTCAHASRIPTPSHIVGPSSHPETKFCVRTRRTALLDPFPVGYRARSRTDAHTGRFENTLNGAR